MEYSVPLLLANRIAVARLNTNLMLAKLVVIYFHGLYLLPYYRNIVINSLRLINMVSLEANGCNWLLF